MRYRLTTALTILLLSFGVVACDDTGEGIEEDAEEIQEGAGDAAEDLEDAGEDLEGDD